MKCPIVINKKLLPYKAYYFLNCAGMSSLIPYIPIYMKYIGLTASESAIIIGVMPFICFFVTPIWCMLADKYHKHKAVLILCTTVSPLLLSASYFLPRVQNTEGRVQVFMQANERMLTVSKCQFIGQNLENKIQCDHSNQEENSLRVTENCRLLCTRTSVDTTNGNDLYYSIHPIQLCKMIKRERYIYCQEFEYKTNLVVENISLVQTADTGCPRYSVTSFHVFGSRFDSVKANSSLNLKCDLICEQPSAKDNKIYDLATDHFSIFCLFFLLYLLYLLFHVPCFRIIDAVTLVALTDEDITKWGRTRVFGTVGWALFAYFSGELMDMVGGPKSESNFLPAFLLYVTFSLLAAVSAFFVNMDKDIHCAQLLKNLSDLLKDLEITIFLIIMLIFGMYAGILATFLNWYLEELCAPKSLMGLATVVAAGAETIVFCISGWILSKTGHRPVFYLTLFFFSVRFASYSLLVNPWHVLLIEPIHGITFGLMMAAVTEYTGIIAPPGMAATLQGLVGGIHWGMGLGIGSLVAGQIYNKFGGVVTFRGSAVSALVVLAIVWPLEHFVVRKRRPDPTDKEELIEEEEDNYTTLKQPMLTSLDSAYTN
ncbi:major facilitator superfamily domain-containing protein 6 [Lingula anatina]|uniref:Major facilitator superfamily domain-containing protein 6 n=1 Tax=Lingula anatina TaxID=7574 RepID=A0A1S3JQL3_LINAN|nr:major facilitator superfamily domain-containing protein 6 [Lingula anatina]XP_013412648.1 major facilitator superfamily domain-containing protein 6 [Lingula anatina]|eukprot:XP_013412647.1 major facilitator superfamily domain-containing protein 6 [Lingula anatina]